MKILSLSKALILSVQITDENKLIYKKYHTDIFNIQNIYKKNDYESTEYEEMLNEAYIKLINSSKNFNLSHLSLERKISKLPDFCIKKYRYILNNQIIKIWQDARSFTNLSQTMDYSALYKKALNKLNLKGSSDEPINYPNLFLRSYEKNIIRILFFLIQDGIVFSLMSDYYNLFSKKLDADIRSAFFYKLKQWMNFELQKKQKQTLYSKYKHINKNNLFPLYYKHKNKKLSLIEELEYWKIFTIENVHADFFDKNFQSVPTHKSNPLYLSTHFVVVSLFSLINNFSEYFNSSRGSNRTNLYLKTSCSGYHSFLQNQIYCDLITLLKMMQINESWIAHVYELNKIILNDTENFINEWNVSKSSIELLKKSNSSSGNTLNQFANLIKETHFNPDENINIYISWLNKNIEYHLIETFFKQAGRKYLKNMNIHADREKNISLIDNYYPIVILNEHKQLDNTRSLFLNLVNFYLHGRKYTLHQLEEMTLVLRNIKTRIAYDHVRLVMSIAKNLRYSNVEVSDLLQEGMIGLIKAVERFQLDRGYQFSTYATWWVHQGLNRVIATQSGSMIPIPTHLQRKVHLIQSTSRELSKKFKREPLIEEIARELKIPIYKIYQFLEAASLSKRLISLDQKVAAEDNRTFQYFLKTVTRRMPVNTTRLFSYIIRFLPPRDSTILKMRLGIIPYKRHTMEQVARIFSVNRDKIKVIERNSLNEIKYNLSQHGRYEQIAPILSTHLSEKILYGHLYSEY